MLKINNAAQYFLYLCDYCGEGKLIVFVFGCHVSRAPPRRKLSRAPPHSICDPRRSEESSRNNIHKRPKRK